MSRQEQIAEALGNLLALLGDGSGEADAKWQQREEEKAQRKQEAAQAETRRKQEEEAEAKRKQEEEEARRKQEEEQQAKQQALAEKMRAWIEKLQALEAARAEVPGYERELDVEQAFNFRHDRQAPIGYLLKMKLGTAMLQPEFGAVDPTLLGIQKPTVKAATGVEAKIKAIGPISRVSWKLGDTDAIEFEARISPKNAQKLMLAQYAKKPEVDLSVEFVVYEFDPVKKKYFIAFSTTPIGKGAPALGQLRKKDDGVLDLKVGSEPEGDVAEPTNYSIEFAIVPKPTPRPLYLGTGPTLRILKTWGRAKKK